MKILVYLHLDPERNIDQYATTNMGFVDELQRAGHNIIVVNPLRKLATNLHRHVYDEFIVEKVKKENQREKIDLFLSSVRDDEMSREAVFQIRKLSIKTVNAVFDNITVPFRVKSISKSFDLCWVHEPEAIETIKGYGGNIFHAYVAANPHLYYPNFVEEDIDVSFCGQSRESRPRYIKELFRHGIKVDIYGEGWKAAKKGNGITGNGSRFPYQQLSYFLNNISRKQGRILLAACIKKRFSQNQPDPQIAEMISAHVNGPLPFTEMVRMFSQSKISLGFNELGQTDLMKKPLFQVRLRDFEAPASGACYIMYRIPIMKESFEEDKEMLFYSSAEELIDKVKYYLDPRRDYLRRKIKEHARERILKQHCWSHRFSKLFKELGIK